MKTALKIMVVLLISVAAFGQGMRFDSVAATTSFISGTKVSTPMMGALVQVCNYPANATPCSNLATIYTDYTTSVACNGSNGCANPLTADASGNYGFWGAANGRYQYTITYKGQSFGPYSVTLGSQSFTQVPVEMFGAVGDWNGTTGTDNTVAIQACLDSLTAGQCMLMNAAYKITAPLVIHKSNVGIGGVSYAITSSTLYPTPSPSKIVIASASADAIQVSGVSPSNTVTYNKFTNFTIQRTTAPGGGTARGLSVQYSYGAIIQGVTSEDSLAGFYFHGAGSQGTGYVENCAATWGYNGFSETSGGLAGFMVDSNDGVPSNSLRIRNSFAANNLGHSASFTTYGYMLIGSAVNDFHSYHVESAGTDYGVWITSSNSGFGASQDIFISEPVLDGAWVSAIFINGIRGSVTVDGGWLNRHPLSTVGSPIVDIENSSHVEIANTQIYSIASTSGLGVYAFNGTNVRVVGNTFGSNIGTAVSFNTVRAGIISQNSIDGITATSVVSLVASPSNVVSANTINGSATNGIFIDSTSTDIKGVETNQIGDSVLGTITNKWSDTSNNAAVHQFLSKSATLTYTSIAAGTSQAQTITITGALVNNRGVTCTPQSGLGAGLIAWSAFVLIPDTVTVSVSNMGGSPVTPSAVAWGCTVTQ